MQIAHLPAVTSGPVPYTALARRRSDMMHSGGLPRCINVCTRRTLSWARMDTTGAAHATERVMTIYTTHTSNVQVIP